MEWKYKEEELRHPTTGAIGAKTPEGDIVYGSLAQQFLTPVEEAPKLTFPEETANILIPESSQNILSQISTEWLEQREIDRQAEMEKTQAELEEVKAERKSLKDRLADFFTKRKPAEDILRAEQEKYGVEQHLKEQDLVLSNIRQTQATIIDLQSKRENALAAIEAQGISSAFVSREQARIADAYDRRINSLSAQLGAESAFLEASQGLISQARGLIGDIVNAYTYDTELELNRLAMFIDMNRDELGMLDTEFQRNLTDSQNYWENRLKQERADMEAILNMGISYPQAGISFKDTLENASNKLFTYLGTQPTDDVKELMLKFPQAFVGLTDEELSKITFAEAMTKIAQLPEEPSWQITQAGRDIYRIDKTTGAVEFLARGAEATPTSVLEWELAGKPGTLADWLTRKDKIVYPYGLTDDFINRMNAQGVNEEDVIDAMSFLRGDLVLPEGEKWTPEEQEKIDKVQNELQKERGGVIINFGD